MAFTEAERVAMYWPERAIRELQAEIQQPRFTASPPRKTLPVARVGGLSAEILDGGCVLYRFSAPKS